MIKIQSFQAVVSNDVIVLYALDVSGQLWFRNPGVGEWQPVEGPKPLRKEKKTAYEKLLELQDDLREQGVAEGEAGALERLRTVLEPDGGPVVDTDMTMQKPEDHVE